MEVQSQFLSRFLSSTALVAALLVGSYTLFDKPFETSRIPSNLDASFLESRLWEDPFKVILSLRSMKSAKLLEDGNTDVYKSFYESSTNNAGDFREALKSELSDTIIFGVTLPEDSFTLTAELRRRVRYAVISAISQTHTPSDNDHISLLSLSPLDEGNADFLASYELYQPYGEIKNKDSFRNKNIIILWIPEDELGDTIVLNFSKVLDSIYPNSLPSRSILLGPSDSNGLLDLYQELGSTKDNQGGSESLKVLLKGIEQSIMANNETDSNPARPVKTLETNAWYASIATNWPPESLSLNDPTGNIWKIVLSTNLHLDRQLDDMQQTTLINCINSQESERFTQENISECLKLLEIGDNDSKWYNIIGSDWPPKNLRGKENADNIWKLIQNVNAYIDKPLNKKQQNILITCLIDSSNETFTAKDISECLFSLHIIDSDYEWFLTIGNAWEQGSLSSNDGLSINVQDLIVNVDLYLDEGLNEQQSEELLYCLTYKSSAISAILSREQVSSCLTDIEVQTNNSNSLTSNDAKIIQAKIDDALNSRGEAYQIQFQKIIQSANSYLDAELSLVNQATLFECLKPNKPTEIFRLTMPSVSHCLNAIDINDSDKMWYNKIASILSSVVIVSPRATVPDSALINISGNVYHEPNKIIRSINSDDKVIGVILGELVRRGLRLNETQGLEVNPENESEPRVALIYESDSSYGRELQKMVICPSLASPPEFSISESKKRTCFDSAYVRSFGYLRGLDGQLPGDSPENNSESVNDSGNKGNLTQQAMSLENSFGRAQYDYLRRLSEVVSKDEYDVIGVLGTDVFDKLLVLQALKAKNPEAIFFTTDLDSSMWHSSQLPWTRNLLVGSSNGLVETGQTGNTCESNNDHNELYTAPFRDNYQTSYFHSTCHALQLFELEKNEVIENIKQQLLGNPKLYEISNAGPVSLMTGGVNNNKDNNPSEGEQIFIQVFFWILLVSPLLSVLIASSSSLNYHRELKGHNTQEFLLGISSSLLVAVFILIYLFSSAQFSLAFQSEEGVIDELLPYLALHTFILLVLFLLGWICIFIYKRYKNKFKIALNALGLDSDNKSLMQIRALKRLTAISCFSLCLLAILVIVLCLWIEFITPGGESITIFNGISHWPMTVIRIQIFVLSVCFALYSYSRWEVNTNNMAERLLGHLDHKGTRKARWSISAWINEINRDNFSTLEKPVSPKRKNIESIWSAYREVGNWKSRLARTLFYSIILTWALFTTFLFLTPQPALIRESYMFANLLFSNQFVFLVIFMAMFMISVGIDVTRLGRVFILALRKYDVLWTNFNKADFHVDYKNEEINMRVCILDIIAKRTRAITPLVFFPFAILFLMIVSRSSLFEGWSWGIQLILVYSMIALYVLFTAVMLQREASLARKETLNYLKEQQSLTLSQTGSEERNVYENAAIEHVYNLNEGAFVVWYEHPIFRALALPASGTSSLMLLQYLY